MYILLKTKEGYVPSFLIILNRTGGILKFIADQKIL